MGHLVTLWNYSILALQSEMTQEHSYLCDSPGANKIIYKSSSRPSLAKTLLSANDSQSVMARAPAAIPWELVSIVDLLSWVIPDSSGTALFPK